jgi:hypothetical protein
MSAAARVTIYGAPDFSPAKARAVASWLRKEARRLRDPKWRKKLDPHYRARFITGEDALVGRIMLFGAARFTAKGARDVAQFLDDNARYVAKREYREVLAKRHVHTYRYA